jgi:hypothetical protein
MAPCAEFAAVTAQPALAVAMRALEWFALAQRRVTSASTNLLDRLSLAQELCQPNALKALANVGLPASSRTR